MRKLTLLTRFWLVAACILITQTVQAELVIIANAESGITAVAAEDIAQVFLGKRNNLNGKDVVAIDQGEGQAIRALFYEKVVNKTESQLNAYWSRLIFTGKGMPPDQVFSDLDVIDRVAEDPELIGYVDSTSIGDDNVRVILSIP